MDRRALVALAALSLGAFSSTSALSQGKDIKIAHIYSKTGALEAYGKQTQTGFMMGLEYATQGTMQVAGRKLVVIEKDDQGKPDLGKSQLLSAADSYSLNDGGTYVDVVPGPVGQILMLSYAVGTEAGGASRLTAQQITLADGSMRSVAQMPIDVQFTLSRPIRLSQDEGGLWLQVGSGLLRLDLAAGEFQVVVQH